MRLLPSQTFVIETSLPISQAVEKLRKDVEPIIRDRTFEKIFKFWKSHKAFEGIVTELEFRLTRISRSNYGCYTANPFLDGHFESKESKTLLIVSARLYPVHRLIILLCWIILGMASIGAVWETISNGPSWTFIADAMLVTFFVTYPFLTRSEIRTRVQKARTDLEKIFGQASKIAE